MASSTIYYVAYSWDLSVRGSAAGNAYCNALDSDGFAMYGGNYVQQSYSSGSIDLWNVENLFTPPTNYTYPSSGSAYYLWNSTQGKWVADGAAFTNGYVTLAGRSNYTVGDNVWCYPNWQVSSSSQSYTQNYSANYSGGTNPQSQTVAVGVSFNLAGALTRSGYTFLGWNTVSDGSGTRYAAGASMKATRAGSSTLYAEWSKNAADTYTVSFDPNGGTGVANPITRAAGKTVSLRKGTDMSRTGYTLKNWNTRANGSGTTYALGGSYTFKAQDETMFAQWEINKYTITYNANGGSGAPAAQTKEYGQTIYISATKPTRTGYNFMGWGTSSTATSASYQPGSAYTANANITLYAIWSAITYKVTYYGNGATGGSTAAQTKAYNGSVTISSNGFSKTGYDFTGWNTNSAGTGSDYSAGQTYSDNADLYLYAKWTKKKYTVAFNANGGTGAPASQTKIHDESLTLTTGVPTRDGYTFLRWNTASNGSGTNYNPGASYTANAAVTLYAQWAARTQFSITYDSRGGSAVSPTTFYQGDSVTLNNTAPTKASVSTTATITYDKVEADATIDRDTDTCNRTVSYTFSNWNTDPNGKGTAYAPGATLKPSASLKLYAIWQETATGNVTLPGGEYVQHALAGWSTSPTSYQRVADPYYTTQDITLYAIWTGNGKGGYITIPSETDLNLSAGDQIRLEGLKDPNNDGLYTVASYVYENGTMRIEFEQDFPGESGAQNAEEDNLNIYGAGSFVPDMDYICSLNNRLWGCSSAARTIYGSALGDPTDFWSFDIDALSAYQVAVGTPGKFTGCVALNSTVLFFKQHTVHKLMGSFPAEYTIYTYAMEGASETNGLSAQNCDGSALYISEHGISIYSGSDVSKVGKELGEGNMRNSISMYNNEKYYLYFADRQDKDYTYVYDLRYGVWVEVDYGIVSGFAHMEDRDYVLMAKAEGEPNALYQINTGLPYTEDWYMVFKPFYEMKTGSYGSKSAIFEKKRYTGLTMRVELPKGSWIKAYVKPDDMQEYVVYREGGRHRDVQDIVIRTPRCDRIQLTLKGHGQCTILGMEREYIVGSRR